MVPANASITRLGDYTFALWKAVVGCFVTTTILNGRLFEAGEQANERPIRHIIDGIAP